MIIPVKCFTCGNVLANKYRHYLEEVRKKKMNKGQSIDRVVYLTKDNMLVKNLIKDEKQRKRERLVIQNPINPFFMGVDNPIRRKSREELL